jgi:hypothetical protein
MPTPDEMSQALVQVPEWKPQTIADTQFAKDFYSGFTSPFINMAHTLYGLVTYPGEVAKKAYQQGYTPSIEPSQEDISKAGDAMMLLAGGGAPLAEKGALGAFGGRLAATADLSKLAKAHDMWGSLAAKNTPYNNIRKEVFDETGWFPGSDTKWRFEIPDNEMSLDMRNMAESKGFGPLDTLVRHDKLYEAYPQLRDWTGDLQKGPVKSGSTDYGNEFINAQAPNSPGLLDIMAHEFQHPIQDIEGFAPGGSSGRILAQTSQVKPELWDAPGSSLAARQVYHRLAGEVEARNAANRRLLSPSERKVFPPWFSEDVPQNMHIFPWEDWTKHQSPQIQNYVKALMESRGE